MTIIVITTVLPAVALLIVALQPYWTPKINFGSMSLSHFHEVIVVNRLTLEAFRNSIVISLVGATLAMVIAVMAAIYVSLQKSAVTAAVDFVLKVPTILPHLIIAVGFVIAFGGSPFFMSGTIAILILAMMVMYISPGRHRRGSGRIPDRQGSCGRPLTSPARARDALSLALFCRWPCQALSPGG